MKEKTARAVIYINKNIPNELEGFKEGYLFIKRVKNIDGKIVEYYSFPGGHVDPGETFEKAVIRELEEELNIKCKITKFLLDLDNTKINRSEKFFLVEYVSGVLKEGSGEEFTNPNVAKYGSFEIVIIPKSEISKYNILPVEVKEKL